MFEWWRRSSDAIRAAVVGGVFTVLAAATAALLVPKSEEAVVTQSARPPEQPISQTGNQIAQSLHKAPLSLVIERIAFDDGGTQYPGGCPNGLFFAVPNAAMASKITGHPGELPGVAVLLPGAAFIAIDTDLPSTDYVRITSLDVTVERYSAEPTPSLFIYNGACADAGPDSALYMFDAVLDPKNRVISLLPGDDESGERLALRQDEPATFGLEFTARAPGWYRCSIALRYRHRSDMYVAKLDRQIDFFLPSKRNYEWFHGWYGETPRRMSHQEVTETIRKIGEWSASPFPAPPAALSQRSGRRPPDKTEF